MRLLPLLLGPILLMTGCAMAWNMGNRGKFQTDIDDVVGQYGAKMTQAECNMIGTSQSGTCVWSASEADRKAIEQGLSLELKDSGGERGGCRSLEAFRGSVILHVANKPVQVPAKANKKFSEFRLFQSSSSRKICVEASYAGG